MKIHIMNINTRSHKDPEKQYGEWWIRNDISEYGVEEAKDGYEDFSIPYTLVNGDTLFLVKGIYSTGDSFGTETGVVEYIELFREESEAISFKEKVDLLNEFITKDWYGYTPKKKKDAIKEYKLKLKGHFKEHKSCGTSYIFVYNGKDYHFPWGGYFENLCDIEIVKLKFIGKDD